MRSFTKTEIEHTYQNWAKVYDWLTPFYLLGNEKRLRLETINLLDLKPGQSVLDIACGTGRNFPLILEKIGPSGTLVGVDYTSAMLARAQERVDRNGWKNVTLIQADAACLSIKQTFDAALCTLAMGVIPDEYGALKQMITHLKLGGQLAVGDAKRSSYWYGRPLNWFADLLGFGAAEVMNKTPWETMRAMLQDFCFAEWFSGFFYVAGGSVENS